MLDLVYLALVAAPLTIAAAAMLLMALRSFRGHADARAGRRRAEIAHAHEHPGGLRKRSAPLVDPPSIASVSDVRSLGRSVVASLANDPRAQRDKPSIEELSALVESLAYPPREAPAPTALGEIRRAEPVVVARVGATPAVTKHCPDCAEPVLAAARVCKHCRYRFDEPEAQRLSV
ncbi:MAG: hypothetical protein JWM73_2312 [Solirubrobacterales bacterium]|nr:hypothetical protein [Solirubrobacterales bacterium]